MAYRSAFDPEFQQAAAVPGLYSYANSSKNTAIYLKDGNNTATIAEYGTKGPAGPFPGSLYLQSFNTLTSSFAGVSVAGNAISTIGGPFVVANGVVTYGPASIPGSGGAGNTCNAGFFNSFGATAISVPTTAISSTDVIMMTASNVSGTAVANGNLLPAYVTQITPGVGFSTICPTNSSNTYNWVAIKRS